MQAEHSHPSKYRRWEGLFNVLLGIFLMLVAYGVFLYASSLYQSLTSCVVIPCTSVQFNSVFLAPLYIFIGIGFVLGLYSIKMILRGMLTLTASIKVQVLSEENVPQPTLPGSETTPPAPPPPVQQQPVLSARIDKCSYCGTELPAGATYCPKCFQRTNR
jgi:hypothetical protein